jgi:large subunit ribosomal protein L35
VPGAVVTLVDAGRFQPGRSAEFQGSYRPVNEFLPPGCAARRTKGLAGPESPISAVVFRLLLCHKPALRRPAKGLPWRRFVPHAHARIFELMPVNRAFGSRFRPDQESQMPKLKTKSGAKKRFKVTGTGKVLAAHAGKRHGMIKRSKKQIRQLRGTDVLFKTDGERIRKYWLPNA